MSMEASRTAASTPAAPSVNAHGGKTAAASGSPPGSGTRTASGRGSRVAQAFSQIVAVLMRDPAYKNMKLADLEHLVLPPVLAGQFRLALGTRKADADKDQKGGIFVPVAVALWARVSPNIDKSLSANLDKQVWLRPGEWTSGDIIWMMAAAGHPRAVPEFLKQLSGKEFQGKPVKMRIREADGKIIVRTLDQLSA